MIWIAAIALAALGGCHRDERPRGTTDVPPELTFDGLTYRVYRGTVLVAEGDAVRAAFRRDNADLAAQELTARFPSTGDRPEARIAARQGTGNLRLRWFQASGGVRAEQGDEVAVTEEARYDAADGLVRGERPIEVRGASHLVVRGPAFTLDPRLERLTIAGGAHITAGEPR
ncbi:hypothetical protein [Anaeromyxobacter diazotrophicus]|uniref:LPS export ABC transporter periplasmic protein LptC n=1 Tax=Anaeromyxobacter diazotrophicus TaxID=2590199 RepID=A0A7I9VMY5_9BACT|nr:hypothetical protein [Anaeromyxobacter diazotrophicus]GEJ57499.1 hypothetical protein AMYX_22400 [Anaeromyxobacter diazotrophicus]